MCWLILAFVGTGTVAAWLGRAWWVCELATHFRVQYAALLLGCAAGLLVTHHPAAAAAAGLGAVANLLAILPAYGRLSFPAAESTRDLRVFLVNVNFRNRAYDQVLGAIRAADPDLVAVIEVNRAWQQRLSALRATYPHAQGVAMSSGWGLLLMSRFPFQESRVVTSRQQGIPYVLARLVVEGRPVTVILAHPYAPMSRRYAAARNRQLKALGEIAAAQRSPLLVLGDLNITPWSPYFRRLLRASGLRDSRHGFGVQPTWPARAPAFLRIPIDHCLVSPGVSVQQRRAGPAVGSDHLPVLIDCALGSSVN